MSIRVVLADDHVIVRDGLRSLLEQAGMEIVAEAAGGLEAVQAAAETQPDVIVMDASMPTLNGIEAARRICAQQPAARVICLSMHAESRFVSAMLEAGASNPVSMGVGILVGPDFFLGSCSVDETQINVYHNKWKTKK